MTGLCTSYSLISPPLGDNTNTSVILCSNKIQKGLERVSWRSLKDPSQPVVRRLDKQKHRENGKSKQPVSLAGSTFFPAAHHHPLVKECSLSMAPRLSTNAFGHMPTGLDMSQRLGHSHRDCRQRSTPSTTIRCFDGCRSTASVSRVNVNASLTGCPPALMKCCLGCGSTGCR